MLSFLKSLDFASHSYGGKAGNLARLAQAGFKVPQGFVLDENDINTMDVKDLLPVIEQIGGFPVAVRSSESLEDSRKHSFAGLFKSYLNVNSVAELEQAIWGCMHSAHSDESRAYLRQQQIFEPVEMHVLIQKMIQPICAGVIFTLHPLLGQEELTLAEWTAGLGDKLASGQVNPHSWTLNLFTTDILDYKKGDGIDPMPKHSKGPLADLALKIQGFFQHPQDIEWALDENEQLWVLQSRAITAYLPRTDVDEHSSSELRDGGVSARATTPLMSSLYREAFNPAMESYVHNVGLAGKGPTGTQWLSQYYGRLFWNVTAVKNLLAKLPGFSEIKFDQDLGLQKDYTDQTILQSPSNPKTYLRSLATLVKLHLEYFNHFKQCRQLRKEFTAVEKNLLEHVSHLGRLNDRELLELFFRVDSSQGLIERANFTTVFNTTLAHNEFIKIFSRLERLSPLRSLSLSNLLGGLGNLSQMSVVDEIKRLSEVGRLHGFDSQEYLAWEKDFMDLHYYHSDAELDLRSPRWSEVPQEIRSRLREISAASLIGLKNKTVTTNPQPAALAERAEAQKICWRNLSPFSWWWFRFQLDLTRKFLGLKEEMRQISSKMYYFYRLVALEIAQRHHLKGQLEQTEDVFFLERKELAQWAQTGFLNKKTLEMRKTFYLGYKNFSPPLEFGGKITASSPAQTGTQLSGIAGSAGSVEGLVRVLHSIDEMPSVHSGEILVTQFIDPGWTPLFSLVSGLITETGGLLSHAGIICREVGIPAILNIPGACARLKTGMRVSLDGASGQVRVLDEAAVDLTGQKNQQKILNSVPWQMPMRKEILEKPKEGSWSLWTHQYLQESYPGPISPLVASMACKAYEFYFRGMAQNLGLSTALIEKNKPLFENMVQSQHSRLYYNVSAMHSLLGEIPFSAWIRKSFLNFIEPLAVEKLQKSNPTKLYYRPLKSLTMVIGTLRSWWQLNGGIRRLEKQVGKLAAMTLENKDQAKLKWEKFFQIRNLQWSQVSFADFVGMMSFGWGEALLKHYRLTGTIAFHDLLQGRAPMNSGNSTKELAQLAAKIRGHEAWLKMFSQKSAVEIWAQLQATPQPELQTLLENYLQQWGFRGPQELMLTKPNFSEDPISFIGLLQSLVQRQNIPENAQASLIAEANSNITFEGLIVKRRLAQKLIKEQLGWSRRPAYALILLAAHLAHYGIQQRERVRVMQGRLYADFRKTCLKLGEILKNENLLFQAEDIFFLQVHEVNIALEKGSADQVTHWVDTNMTAFAKDVSQPLPMLFWLSAQGQIVPALHQEVPSMDGHMSYAGLGVSGGASTGQARVIRDLSEASSVKDQDILIVPFADAGWAPLFSKISGLIIERGGLLSHGAILAREYGIPAIIVDFEVCRRLDSHHGRIHLDGDKGTFSIL